VRVAAASSAVGWAKYRDEFRTWGESVEWLGSNGKSPAEMSLKVRLRSILAPKADNR
jgi:hypothetical protein